MITTITQEIEWKKSLYQEIFKIVLDHSTSQLSPNSLFSIGRLFYFAGSGYWFADQLGYVGYICDWFAIERACEIFLKLINESAKFLPIRLYLLGSLIQLSRSEIAEPLAKEYLNEFDKEDRLAIGQVLAHILIIRGKVQQANDLCQSLAPQLWESACQHHKRRQSDDKERVVRLILQQKYNLPLVIMNGYTEKGFLETCERAFVNQIFEKTAEEDMWPTHKLLDETLEKLGRNYYQMNLPRSALNATSLSQSLGNHSNLKDRLIARSLFSLGQSDAAIKIYQKLFHNDPSDKNICMELCLLAIGSQDRILLSKVLDEGEKSGGRNYFSLLLRGYLYECFGNQELALAEYQKAESVEKNSEEPEPFRSAIPRLILLNHK